MAWDKGFNFRATQAFTTDLTGTYVIGDTYPTTRNGVTFGWTTALSDGIRNRDAAVDYRLVGCNKTSNNGSTQRTFRVDLAAAASHIITLAIGDTDNTQGYQYLLVKDTSTTVVSIIDTGGTANGHFDDATGTDRTKTSWPGSNATTTQVFATTIANVTIGAPTSQSDDTTLAHLFLSQISPTIFPELFATSFQIPSQLIDNTFEVENY